MGTNCIPHLTDIFLYSYESVVCSRQKRNISLIVSIWRAGTQVHRWCIEHNMHKRPRLRKLHGQDVSFKLEIKDTTESNTSASFLDLLLSIGREVNLTLLFMTNTTISISTSQTFCSLVAIFHLCPPMVFLAYSFYEMSWISWKYHTGSSMVHTKIILNNMKFAFHKY